MFLLFVQWHRPLPEKSSLFQEAELIHRYSIQQYSFPGSPLANKHFRKFHRQDDCFLNHLLCLLQPTNILPLHIRFLPHNCIGNLSLQFIELWIFLDRRLGWALPNIFGRTLGRTLWLLNGLFFLICNCAPHCSKFVLKVRQFLWNILDISCIFFSFKVGNKAF